MLRHWPCGAVPKNKFGHWWDMNGYRSRRADVAFGLASYSSHYPKVSTSTILQITVNTSHSSPPISSPPIRNLHPSNGNSQGQNGYPCTMSEKIGTEDFGPVWSRCKLPWCNPMLCLSLCWHLTSRKWELQKPVAWLWPRIVMTTHLSCVKRDSIPTSSYIYPPPPRIEKSKWV